MITIKSRLTHKYPGLRVAGFLKHVAFAKTRALVLVSRTKVRLSDHGKLAPLGREGHHNQTRSSINPLRHVVEKPDRRAVYNNMLTIDRYRDHEELLVASQRLTCVEQNILGSHGIRTVQATCTVVHVGSSTDRVSVRCERTYLTSSYHPVLLACLATKLSILPRVNL